MNWSFFCIVINHISNRLLHGDNENSKNVYKQAFNISKTNLVSPKIKRINENVTKIYGFEDPPPGFGFSYPRFYFIEQKKPQPMNPLKVWRGYNGNVYFEPIQTNKIYNNGNDLEPSSKCEQCLKATSVKTKQIYVSSHQMKEDNKPKSSSTKEREQFIGRIDLNKSVENGFPNSLKAVRDKRSLNLKPIVPNLAAVKRTNVPMKGLAYKESKEKINDSNPKMFTSDLNREASDLNVYIYYDIDSKTTKREFSCSKNREKSGNIHKGFTYRMNQNELEKQFGEYSTSKGNLFLRKFDFLN